MSVEETGTVHDSTQRGNGRETNNGVRRRPRVRHKPDGVAETQAVSTCGSDWMPPTVSIDPSAGSYTSASLPVTIDWSDETGLDRFARRFTLNGLDVTSQFAVVGGTYTSQGTGTLTLSPGQNTLTAEVWDQAGNYNSATANYTYTYTPPPAHAPQVARQDDPAQVSAGIVHPGSAVLRDLCVTIAAGPGAAYECGDLRLAHALPTTRVLNAARTPVLLYNSQHAHPRPVVPFNVQLNAGSMPTQVRAILYVGEVGAQPVLKADTTWISGGWQAGLMRFAVGFDASAYATTAYTYRLQVVGRINGMDQMLMDQYGDLSIVNRAASPFGAGWWMAGLEQMVYIPGDGSWLGVGGDGSTRRYYWSAPGTWKAPHVDGADTLWAAGGSFADGFYRKLPNGSVVWYDGSGRHSRTVTRLGYTTSFTYDTQGRLGSVVLPKPAGSTVEAQYIMTYDDNNGGRLAWICAHLPSTGCRLTEVLYGLGDRRVTGIRDPDNTIVGFGYDGAGREVKRRTDRRTHTTSFEYDAVGRLRESSLPVPLAGHTVRHVFSASESAGRLVPVPAANVVTTHDGPRTDATDVTDIWVNRWGAPTRVRNAAGYNTYLTRSDSRFPALVTRVDHPGGRYVTAGYDALGNLEVQTDWSHTRTLQDGSTGYSTTRYARTDPAWPNFVTQVTLPEGEVTRTGYHTNGNRAWQQPGNDATMRVGFDYNSLGLVEWINHPATATQGAARERLEYDARGNLQASSTPQGYRTVYHNDAFGRTWKTESPIDGTRVMVQENTFYPNSDLVEYSRSIGPDMNGAGPQTVTVRTIYDDEGNPLSVARRSDPDPNLINWVTTQFRYDVAGRRVAEVAPDGMVDSTFYDAAGNAREVLSRRRDAAGAPLKMTMQYDALNRLTQRLTPEVRYAARNEGMPTRGIFVEFAEENGTYPRYPNDGGTGYLIPADLATFTYTALGLETANNGDAQITRTYFPNGSLHTETQRIRATAGGDFSQHVYETVHTYDLNGRRTALRHPTQLAPSASQNTTRYTYDPLTGAPRSIVDALGKEFRYTYNTRGEAESLQQPGGISEEYGYNQDGGLLEHRVRNNSGSPYRSTASYLRSTTFQYDQRGKVLQASDLHATTDTMRAAYTGLGQLAFGGITSRSYGNIGTDCPNTWVRSKSGETTRMDALGNMHQSIAADSLWWRCGTNNTYQNDRSWGYVAGVGRLAWTQNFYQRDTTHYDAAGNSVFETQARYNMIPAGAVLRDRVSYYAADGTLRAAESRTRTNPTSDLTGMFSSAFEEYRYDALGRRVWVRARRYCETDDAREFAAECNIDKVRRTVWDGDHELYEIQMPGTGPYMEYDTNLPELGMVYDAKGGGYGVDPNPFFGRVAYTHGLGTDQPLGVIRLGYSDRVIKSNYAPARYRTVQPFGIVPLWSSRGQADLGVFDDGGLDRCETDVDGKLRCVQIAWPGRWFANERPKFRPFWWHGSVVEDKRDATGTLYRRNRYLDAQTGRFTQEDPIGLAGGLNAYGYAEGDPVSYSDPYGLCARDASGREDFDCVWLIKFLTVVARAAEREAPGIGVSHFRTAAEIYRRTNRDIQFVPGHHWRANRESETETMVGGETVRADGPVLLNQDLLTGDLAAVATHEAIYHVEAKVVIGIMHLGDLTPGGKNMEIWLQLPNHLEGSAPFWNARMHPR